MTYAPVKHRSRRSNIAELAKHNENEYCKMRKGKRLFCILRIIGPTQDQVDRFSLRIVIIHRLLFTRPLCEYNSRYSCFLAAENTNPIFDPNARILSVRKPPAPFIKRLNILTLLYGGVNAKTFLFLFLSSPGRISHAYART